MRHLLTHYRAHLKVSTKPRQDDIADLKNAKNHDFEGPQPRADIVNPV